MVPLGLLFILSGLMVNLIQVTSTFIALDLSLTPSRVFISILLLLLNSYDLFLEYVIFSSFPVLERLLCFQMCGYLFFLLMSYLLSSFFFFLADPESSESTRTRPWPSRVSIPLF